MNGPEHYQRAEKTLAVYRDTPADSPDQHLILALAQVHATLALAAAVAGIDAQEGPNGGSAAGRSDWIVWKNAGAVSYE